MSGRERECGICVGGRVSGMNQSVSQSVSQSNWFLSIYKSSFNLFRTTPKYRPQCFAFVPSVSGLCCAVLRCAVMAAVGSCYLCLCVAGDGVALRGYCDPERQR